MTRRASNPPPYAPPLPFGALFNSDFLSNHWLEHRLQLEPEWTELRAESDAAFGRAMALWRRERERVERYENEAGLEHGFIQPMFEILGWKPSYQTWLDQRKPDYALFFDDASKDAALKQGPKTPEFWSHPALLADAKAWHISLDRPHGIGNQREYPPQQIEWYLNRSGLNFGILSNGRLWRLIPRQLGPGKARFQTYLQTDLARLLDAPTETANQAHLYASEEFFRFYLFFSPAGFARLLGQTTLIERAISGSSEYALSVGEDLKERVFEALRLCIEGFLKHPRNQLAPDRHLELCREQSFVLLYRLLFIMYAEDRSLLPYGRNELYTDNRSLTRHRREIARALDQIEQRRAPDYPVEQVTIWRDLAKLFDLINEGRTTYGVPPYNGGLFDPDQHQFLKDKELPDRYMARVIDQLGRAPDPQHPPRGLFTVDYRDLAIQHLGGIYEGLLELRPHFATDRMIVIRERRGARKAERIVAATVRVQAGWEPTGTQHEPGSVYLLTDKGERRATGSYYTPDHIVSYIVEQTLGPLCAEISQTLAGEIAGGEEQHRKARGANRDALSQKLAKLRTDYDDRVLRLRVLDPAMGSGHFLVRACQHLAEEIATSPYASEPAAEGLREQESILTYWKRRVVENCIFGVDFNPMAVELAKLALWLETVSIDEPLTFLDHHLRTGNSLIGARVRELGALPDIAAGPNLFQQTIEQQLPVLLEPLVRIRELPSQKPEQIKEKERLYRQTFQPLCENFRTVADLWTSTFFTPDRQQVTPAQYERALAALQRTSDFRRLTAEPWLRSAIDRVRTPQVRAFHWEMEFPEAFFDLTRQDRDASFHHGFDAIIGNPPWGSAQFIDTLRRMPLFESVNEDHAECFLCLGPALLSATGRFGMVLPDTVLSPAKYAVRHHILTNTRTTHCYNIGPDWFTTDVRMSTVLWLAIRSGSSNTDYSFATAILPITVRRDCQAGRISLALAIAHVERKAFARAVLDDPHAKVPLFGDVSATKALSRVFEGALTLEELCDHTRGVELNKAGKVTRCPHCSAWNPPPQRKSDGTYSSKRCGTCETDYHYIPQKSDRILVRDLPGPESHWRAYIDGDSIRRYSVPVLQSIDTSAHGINYKPSTYYRPPKILIRQAGIGLGAILDSSDSYCPQSVYVYRVKDMHRDEAINEATVLSLLCSRVFQMQVFVSFAEIDSSRAFSKLTHVRLSRLPALNRRSVQQNPRLVQHIMNSVALLATEGALHREQEDWNVEACWAGILGLTLGEMRAIIQGFAHVHESEALLSLFPGGVCGRESHWLSLFEQAATRCGVKL